jgi:GNAT superfamily N-acetyltransferase
MNQNIQIIEKPEWVSWDEIHNVLWRAHEKNRQNGIIMALPALHGNLIREKIEGHGKMFVALDGEKVVGTAALTIKQFSLWCGKGSYAYLCFASVLPEYNGKGIYKALNLRREELALSMGLVRIIGDTHENNKHRLDIAKKTGYKFVDLKICKDHYNIVMVKWLNECPYSNFYCNLQFTLRKAYKKLRFKPGRVKRFGI